LSARIICPPKALTVTLYSPAFPVAGAVNGAPLAGPSTLHWRFALKSVMWAAVHVLVTIADSLHVITVLACSAVAGMKAATTQISVRFTKVPPKLYLFLSLRSLIYINLDQKSQK
jgi:hypothetical protein